MSEALRPLPEKEEMRVRRSAVGPGMSVFAELKLAVVESLLPNSTVHVGPPNCEMFSP